MVFCSKCGRILPESANYCTACGTRVVKMQGGMGADSLEDTVRIKDGACERDLYIQRLVLVLQQIQQKKGGVLIKTDGGTHLLFWASNSFFASVLLCLKAGKDVSAKSRNRSETLQANL